MHKRTLPPVQARRHFRTLSDDDARRAAEALQQLAAGLDDDQSASPRPASSSSDRSAPAWRSRLAGPPSPPRPLR